MKKYIKTGMTCFMLWVLLGCTVAAAGTESGHPKRLVDDADILTTSEEEELTRKLDEVSENRDCDVVVVTVESLDGKTSEAYADDYFDYEGYGMGPNDDGILLLLSMEERDWAISTYSFGVEAFTDAGQEKMMDEVLPLLADDDYYDAFDTYADQCDELLEMARNGNPYDVGNTGGPGIGFILVVCLLIGLVSAGILTGAKYKQLKMIRYQTGAADYMRAQSLNVTRREDRFLFHTVNRTAIPQSSGSGGGSSTHTSSSGRTHGGSHGKF